MNAAAAWADEQTSAVRDDPAARIALMQRCYHGPYGRAPHHLPFRRAASSFMRWQLRRGLLHPDSGSPWWRAVNERILRDGCEAVALSGDLPGTPSSPRRRPDLRLAIRAPSRLAPPKSIIIRAAQHAVSPQRRR
ncbi:hypothetical protein [Paractinoplanes durhamensis]|uniref:hypothetical protein n=1 Tax=Paractinoplanes durhamensis TaxID=113563 RepID=UPI003635D908